MRRLNERTVLIIIITMLSISGLLCLFGLTTSGWNGHSIFSARTSTAILIIISFILLVACVSMVAFIVFGYIVHEYLPFIFVVMSIVSSIFMLAAFTSFFSDSSNYSYSIMISSFTFTYISSLIATYWLFDVHKADKMILISDKHSQTRLNVLT